MKILVTGGAGFIGSHTAEHFANTEHSVRVFDNLSRALLLGQGENGTSHSWNYLRTHCPSIKLTRGDLRSAKDVISEARGSDVIIHTGAQVAVTTSLNNPRIDFEVNALGTINVLEAARLNDSAVILCSTNKVYGENVNSIPVRELETRYEFADPRFADGVPENLSVDLTNHTPYGCSKLSADLYTQDYAHTYGLRTGVFRLSCVYGTRQYGVEDQGWVAWFARCALANKQLTIYGNGKQVRDVLWMDDLVNAFELFLRSPSKHEVLNIGGGPANTISLLELAEMLRRATGHKLRVRFSKWRKADQRVYVSNTSRAYEKLKWKPSTDPHAGIARLVSWIKNEAQIKNSRIPRSRSHGTLAKKQVTLRANL